MPPVYTLMNEALSWSDANAACLAKGLQLASVHSAAENALLVTAAAGNSVWIGGTDAASEGTWEWSPSGTPLMYTKWDPGEPNNMGNEDCVEVHANGGWNDISCALHRKYVCETPRCTGASTFAGKAWGPLRTAVVEYNSNAAAAIAKYGPIACWDVSGVTDMSHLFKQMRNFDTDISSWDTSAVTSMYAMFEQADEFNQPLTWDTSRVTDMRYMFINAKKFNQPLLGFDTSRVTSFYNMFGGAISLSDANKLLIRCAWAANGFPYGSDWGPGSCS